MPTTLVWFRTDLRLEDNPALRAAAERGVPVIPVFIWAPQEEGDWPPGGASRWWLHHSLHALNASLRRHHSRLILRQGDSLGQLRAIARTVGADAVYWNRRYEPAVIQRDEMIATELAEAGLDPRPFNGALLHEPRDIATGEGRPYQVFTAFWRACQSRDEPAEPSEGEPSLSNPDHWPSAVELDDLGLLPTIDWAAGLRDTWTPGERAAHDQLAAFLDEPLGTYDSDRDRPDQRGTSRLSPHLHWGEISPRQVWHAVKARAMTRRSRSFANSVKRFLAELGWREFGHHLLYHFPHTPKQPLRSHFAAFPWREDQDALAAWQQGRTGYPMVDAGMRELWHTGWMHNRVRMIVASFLVKDLLLPWQHGAQWFWDTLVDADLANNTLGWQWAAGCGADAAPYFRIFNPTTQSERYDPKGGYIRRHVRELTEAPDQLIHAPHAINKKAKASQSATIIDTYPEPIVDHAHARQHALAAFEKIKGNKR